ncbi:MAG: alkaline phosphatase D family protein [Gaiellales bacterium]
MRRRYTRAAVLGGATVVGAGVIGVRLASGGRRLPPPPGNAPSAHMAESAFERMPAGPGWGYLWVPVHYSRPLAVGGQGAVYPVPAGLHQTAADQQMPVMRRDFGHADGEQVLDFTIDDPTLRPGVLLRSSTPYRYASATIEAGQLVLADNEFDGRVERARAGTAAVTAGLAHRLQVRYLGGRIWARAWPLHDSAPGWQVEASISTRETGDPGILCVHPTSLRPSSLLVHRHQAATDETPSPTPPACPVLMAGIPESTPGGHRIRLRAWSASPATVRFEWSEHGPQGPFQHGQELSADAAPYTALTAVETAAPVLDWRVRVTSKTSGAVWVSPPQRVTLPDPAGPLTLLSACCYKLIGATRNEGYQRLEAAAAHTPASLVFEGDLGYPGNWRDAVYHRSADYFADRFQRALVDPGFARARRVAPVGFIMDDHDYGPDNNANRTNVEPWAIAVKDSITADPTTDGYFDFRFGDVHCLTLDGRRYADPVTAPNSPSKTKLGMGQRSWMEHILRTSDARLFVLFSADMFGTRWNDGTGKRTLDCFIYGWPDEYRWAMTLFMDTQLRGRRVLILSGDCHSLRINQLPDPEGRQAAAGMRVTEFVCAGIRAELWEAAAPDDHTVDRSRYVLGQSGSGLVEIDAPGATQRSITLRAITSSGPHLDAWRPLVLPFSPQAG